MRLNSRLLRVVSCRWQGICELSFFLNPFHTADPNATKSPKEMKMQSKKGSKLPQKAEQKAQLQGDRSIIVITWKRWGGVCPHPTGKTGIHKSMDVHATCDVRQVRRDRGIPER